MGNWLTNTATHAVAEPAADATFSLSASSIYQMAHGVFSHELPIGYFVIGIAIFMLGLRWAKKSAEAK
jgi:hypothetical protein